MSFSNSHQWSVCCQHQQEIALLQEKLMEIHNKLLDQLDVCRDQQLTIIELNKQIHNQKSQHQHDTFNYQSFGQHSQQNYQYHQQNRSPNFESSINHDSRQSHQTKTELLQADLEAMRNKVLGEITQKNRLKEQMREMKATHKKQLAYQVKKCEGLENLMRKLQQQHEYLQEKFDKYKSTSARVEPEIQRLSQKLSQVQSKYSRQKQFSKKLQIEKSNLEKIIQDYQRSKFRNNFEKQNKQTHSQFTVLNQQRQIDQLKYQIQKLNKNIQVRQVDFRQRGDQRKKKRGFQQTKELIKKLQETQINTRKNRKGLY